MKPTDVSPVVPPKWWDLLARYAHWWANRTSRKALRKLEKATTTSVRDIVEREMVNPTGADVPESEKGNKGGKEET